LVVGVATPLTRLALLVALVALETQGRQVQPDRVSLAGTRVAQAVTQAVAVVALE
tara:strand:- start:586 stop:750 length:165 start_codon:yes stop_codon:yes gene_type:complete